MEAHTLNHSILERYENVHKNIDAIESQQRYFDIRSVELQQQIFDYNDKIEDAQADFDLLDKSIKIMQELSDDRNSTSKEALRDLINWTLSKVFPNSHYTVHIEEHVDARSGKKMEMFLTDNITGKPRSFKHNLGNSILQAIAFLMRLIVIKISGCSRIIVLDEFFSGIRDKEAIQMFGEVLTSIAANEDFQIIITEQLDTISEYNEDFHFIDVELLDKSEGLVIKNVT